MDVEDSKTPADTLTWLLAALAPARKTTIVDVGANPIYAPDYADLLRVGGCKVVGFEPQAAAFAELQKNKGPDETYYPFAVGTGETLSLRIYKSSGMTSIFDPYVPTMAMVNEMGMARVRETVAMDTVALDQTTDLPEFDLLKIDIQGAENLVFQGAERVLKGCISVMVELRYMRLYHGEPMLGGVDTELRRQGFYLHKFMFNKGYMLTNSQARRLKAKKLTDQLIDGDGVYLRNIAELDAYSDEQLKHQAILAAGVFHSHSLVLYCLDALVARKAIAVELPGQYVDRMPEALRTDVKR
ncbi:FkbM family methyltransferase [Cypionkella sp.]|uniref:FkbM family methyltransferase n=1 Tax=Cypionkella sp. TaxID=2811411 RepID=UPI00271BE541|nr:FkbM family methyltransferase [Cypionkella sp.]MDO8983652.1 FkbM family methyltransferase [Cypionkella sp.]MDP2050113.1 FkbM family methyltransferase [Cypionkella sp.]